MFKTLFIGITTILAFVSLGLTAYFKSDYTNWNTNTKSFMSGIEVERIFYKLDNILYTILGMVIIGVIIYTIIKLCKKFKISNKLLVGIGILFSITLCSLIVFKLNVKPRADQIQVLNGAINSIKGDFSSFDKSQYFGWYPFQIGIVFYVEMLLRLFKSESYILIQSINILLLAITYIYMYKCIDKIVKRDIAKKISIIFMFLFIPVYPYVTFVYGNIPGLMFGVISIYYMLNYFDNKKIYNLILSAITIAIAINLKNNYLIFFIAEAIVYFVYSIKNRDYKLIAVILFAFILNKGMYKSVEKYYEIRGNMELSKGIPKNAWMVMAMQEGNMAPGWFNGYSVNVYSRNDYDNAKTTKAANEDLKDCIKNFISNPIYAFKFYTRKSISQWSEPTFESTWIIQPWIENEYYERVANSKFLDSIFKGKLRKIYDVYCESLLILIYSLSVIGIIRNFKNIDIKSSIFIIIFLGGFAFHLLWEGKSQYTWIYILCAIPYCGLAFNELKKRQLRLNGK